MEITDVRKQYRTVGITVFIVAIALLVMRIVSYYVQIALIDFTMDEAWLELMLDAIFSVPVQLGFLLLMPFLMYKLALKKSFKGVLSFSGYHKCNFATCLIAIPLGFFMVGISYGLSIIWQGILIIFGYNPSGGGTLPASFNIGYFLLTVLLTAVLPAICEEFVNRGGLLTTLNGAFGKKYAVFFIAVAFGLFHQNITQVVYTACFGGLLAYLVLETGSVYPAMIIHFMNNFVSVLIDNATTYNWAIGGGFYDFIGSSSLGKLGAMLALICIICFGLVVAIVYIARRTRTENIYLRMHEEVKNTGFHPSLRDNVFFIGAICVTVISTVLTFIFGL